jgi:hypothetical protein
MSNVTCVQGGLAPIDLKVESFYHRAAPGGTGGVKTIGNYAPVSHLSSFLSEYNYYKVWQAYKDERTSLSTRGIGTVRFCQWAH